MECYCEKAERDVEAELGCEYDSKADGGGTPHRKRKECLLASGQDPYCCPYGYGARKPYHQTGQDGERCGNEIQKGEGEDVPGGSGGHRSNGSKEGGQAEEFKVLIHGGFQSAYHPLPTNVVARTRFGTLKSQIWPRATEFRFTRGRIVDRSIWPGLHLRGRRR